MNIKRITFGLGLAAMLGASSVSFASELGAEQSEAAVRGFGNGRMTKITERFQGRMEKRAEKHGVKMERKENRGVKLDELVTTYAPELADDFEVVKTEREALREQRREENQAKIEERREEMLVIIDQYKNGEITREEISEKLKAHRDLAKVNREEMKAKREENREEHEAFRAKFKEAVENKDAETIKECLEEILERQQERLAEIKAEA